MRPETKPSRCFRHTHKTMLAAICIASALARRSAPERPAWSLRDDLPAPFSILPGPPARSKGLVYDFLDNVKHLLHDSKKRSHHVFVVSSWSRIPATVHPPFTNGSAIIHVPTSLRDLISMGPQARLPSRAPARH